MREAATPRGVTSRRSFIFVDSVAQSRTSTTWRPCAHSELIELKEATGWIWMLMMLARKRRCGILFTSLSMAATWKWSSSSRSSSRSTLARQRHLLLPETKVTPSMTRSASSRTKYSFFKWPSSASRTTCSSTSWTNTAISGLPT